VPDGDIALACRYRGRRHVRPCGICAHRRQIIGDGFLVMASKWRLEIHDETKGSGSILSFFEFDDFPSLRSKIVENRGRAFLVRPPGEVNQTELTSLLDLRGQGFNVERN
jgi:hypothetical protein